MNCQGYKDIVAAHVDGALATGELAAVEGHLEVCGGCRRMYAWEREAKRVLKRRLGLIAPRPGLKHRVLERLEGRAKSGFWAWAYWRHGWAVGLAVLLLFVLPYFGWRENPRPDLFSGAIERYQKVVAGAAHAESAEGLAPAARVLDLSPWGYRVLAKQRQEVGGFEGRVFVYQGERREFLLAQEFERANFSPPNGAKVIRASNRDFLTYTQEGINLIAFKEKDVLCILTSALPKEKLLGMAQQIVMAN